LDTCLDLGAAAQGVGLDGQGPEIVFHRVILFINTTGNRPARIAAEMAADVCGLYNTLSKRHKAIFLLRHDK